MENTLSKISVANIPVHVYTAHVLFMYRAFSAGVWTAEALIAVLEPETRSDSDRRLQYGELE